MIDQSSTASPESDQEKRFDDATSAFWLSVRSMRATIEAGGGFEAQMTSMQFLADAFMEMAYIQENHDNPDIVAVVTGSIQLLMEHSALDV